MKLYLPILIILLGFSNVFSQIIMADSYAGGDGSKLYPYQIETFEQLLRLSETTDDWDKYFELIADIDASASRELNIVGDDTLGFSPIGATNGVRQEIEFIGSFDGKGHEIANLYINRPNEDYVGLFGYTSAIIISNVLLIDANITGDNKVGGLIGYSNTLSSEISEFLGVTGNVYGNDTVGGVFGKIEDGIFYYNISFANVHGNSVVGGVSGSGIYRGGFLYNGCFYGTLESNGLTGPIVGDTVTRFSYFAYYDYERAGVFESKSLQYSLNSESFAIEDSLAKLDFEDAWQICIREDIDSFARPYPQIFLDSYTFTFHIGANGFINPSTTQTVLACNEAYPIEVYAFSDYIFVGWFDENGDYYNDDNPLDLTGVTQDLTLTAIFSTEPTVTFSTPENGILRAYNGSVIDNIENATSVKAVADSGYRFYSWQNQQGGTVSFDDSLELAIFKYDTLLTAVFERNEFTVHFSNDGNGSVEGDTLQMVEFEGNSLFVTAVANEYYTFAQWELSDGTVYSTDNPMIVTGVGEDMNVIAKFSFISPFAGGDGSVSMPYQIENFQQLEMLSFFPDVWARNFELIANIDASASRELNIVGDDTLGFSPIGAFGTQRQGIPFTGLFEGNNFTISNLYINRPNEQYVGLFGYVDDGANLYRFSVTNATVVGGDSVGIVCGYTNDVDLLKVYSTGTVEGVNCVGGICGMKNSGIYTKLFSFANVTGTEYVGGIIGHSRYGQLSYSYHAGIVAGMQNRGQIYGYDYNTYDPGIYFDRTIGNSVNGGTGVTTTGFSAQSNFPSLDFVNDWAIGIIPEFDSTYRPYYSYMFDYIVSTKVDPEGVATTYGDFGYLTGQTAKISTSPIDETSEFNYWELGIMQVTTDSVYEFEVPEYTGFGKYGTYNFIANYRELFNDRGGDGSVENPFEIATFEDLVTLSENVTLLDNHYILVADIDASQSHEMNIEGTDTLGFFPIGDRSDRPASHGIPFTGTFNGNGHIISNLYINRAGNEFAGLFGSIEERAHIYDLGLVDADVTGGRFSGVVVGNGFSSTVERVFSSGKISDGGGLIGYFQNGIVKDVFSLTNVKSGAGLVASLVASTLSNAYACGKVEFYPGLINNYESALAYDCYFDKQTTTQTIGIATLGGVRDVKAYNTSSFAVKDSFPGFDYDNIWKIALITKYDSVPRPYFTWMKRNTITLSLVDGWNLLSFPFTPSAAIVDSVFPHASIVKNATEYFNIEQLAMFNTLTIIEQGKAYLVNNTLAEEITVTGSNTASTSSQTTLKKGWNMLGVPNDSLYQVTDLPGEISIIKNFDGYYEAGNTESTLTVLMPGEGYFVNVSNDCTIKWDAEKNIVEDTTTSGTVTDIDGNEYPWIKIGEQRWMTRNLRVTRYADGTELTLIQSKDEWGDQWLAEELPEAYCYYDTVGTGYTDYTEEIFGVLYNKQAANRGETGYANPNRVQGICPNGWHMPSDAEWFELQRYLAEHEYEINGVICDSTAGEYERNNCAEDSYLAKSLATDWGWKTSSGYGAVGNSDYPEKQNASGFSGVPAGFRQLSGEFYGVGENAWWWSTSDLSDNAGPWLRMLFTNYAGISRDYNGGVACSVRCVKD